MKAAESKMDMHLFARHISKYINNHAGKKIDISVQSVVWDSWEDGHRQTPWLSLKREVNCKQNFS